MIRSITWALNLTTFATQNQCTNLLLTSFLWLSGIRNQLFSAHTV